MGADLGEASLAIGAARLRDGDLSACASPAGPTSLGQTVGRGRDRDLCLGGARIGSSRTRSEIPRSSRPRCWCRHGSSSTTRCMSRTRRPIDDGSGGCLVHAPLAAIESASIGRTKAVIIQSPLNPIGVVHDAALLQRLDRLIARRASPAPLFFEALYSGLALDDRDVWWVPRWIERCVELEPRRVRRDLWCAACCVAGGEFRVSGASWQVLSVSANAVG